LVCKHGRVCSILSLLFASVIVPAAAKESATAHQRPTVDARARVIIHNSIEIRSPNISGKSALKQENIGNVSLHDCDAEASKLIENCVLQIYEVQ